jgi:hypothetical protein
MRPILCFIFAVFLIAFAGCGGRVRPIEDIEDRDFRNIVVTEQMEIAGINDCNNPVVVLQSTTRSEISCGSGTLVNYKGSLYVVTARHVISSGGTLSIWQGDKKINASLGTPREMISADIAIIPITETHGKLATMPLGIDVPTVDENCSAAGYVSNDQYIEKTGTITEASLSTIQVEPGMSGGPIIINGKIAGVTTSQMIRTDSYGKSTTSGKHAVIKDCIQLFN